MSGMLLTEGVSWLHGPAPLTKLALVTKTASAGVTNWARYSDPEVDELHLKYRNSSDVAGRKAAYKTIQEKAAGAAATAKPPVLIGRQSRGSPKMTGVTLSQEADAGEVC